MGRYRVAAASRRFTGEQREVDIVADAVVGGYPLVLSIEVRDRGRPADVTWLEAVAKKHEHLSTNKLVVWSASGFTDACLKKAKALGIDTVAPGSLTDAPWASLARALVGGSIKWVQPELNPSADVILDDGTCERWACRRETVLTEQGGTREILVGAPLDQIVRSPEVRTVFLDHAPEGSGDFHAIYDPPFPCSMEGPAGAVGKVTRLVIGIRTHCEIAPLDTKSALYASTATTLAEATVGDGTLRLVMREMDSMSPSIAATHNKSHPVEGLRRSAKRQP